MLSIDQWFPDNTVRSILKQTSIQGLHMTVKYSGDLNTGNKWSRQYYFPLIFHVFVHLNLFIKIELSISDVIVVQKSSSRDRKFFFYGWGYYAQLYENNWRSNKSQWSEYQTSSLFRFPLYWHNISPFLTTFLSVHRPLQLVHVIIVFAISVTVFSNPTKLTDLLSLLSKFKQIFALTDDAIRTEISFMKINQTFISHLAGLCFTPSVKTFKKWTPDQ